jgi:hypothetical protein
LDDCIEPLFNLSMIWIRLAFFRLDVCQQFLNSFFVVHNRSGLVFRCRRLPRIVRVTVQNLVNVAPAFDPAPRLFRPDSILAIADVRKQAIGHKLTLPSANVPRGAEGLPAGDKRPVLMVEVKHYL